MTLASGRLLALPAALLAGGLVVAGGNAPRAQPARAEIPRTWVDAEVADVEVPLAHAEASPVHVTADYYYKIPVRPIYRSYPIYAPGREPAGYYDALLRAEPERLLDDLSNVRSDDEWTRAGETVFDAAIAYTATPVREPDWHRSVDPPDRRRWHDRRCSLRRHRQGTAARGDPVVRDVPHQDDGRRHRDRGRAGQLPVRPLVRRQRSRLRPAPRRRRGDARRTEWRDSLLRCPGGESIRASRLRGHSRAASRDSARCRSAAPDEPPRPRPGARPRSAWPNASTSTAPACK